MKYFDYIGTIDNWMDFRDKLIELFKECDNEYKFNKLLNGLILSISSSTKTINETRKSIGLKELSKAELKKIKSNLEEK